MKACLELGRTRVDPDPLLSADAFVRRSHKVVLNPDGSIYSETKPKPEDGFQGFMEWILKQKQAAT